MHYRLYLIILIAAFISVPAVAASRQQVPTPTGFLGGRESAGETATVAVVPPPTITPPASPMAADTPDATDCDAVLDTRDIAELTGPPASGIVSPAETRRSVPSRTLAELPKGDPVTGATVQAVEQTVRRLIACSNSHEAQKLMALYTDDYFRRAATVTVERQATQGTLDWLFGVSETTSTNVGFAGFPPDTAMPDLSRVTILPDGRIGAIVSGPGFDPIFFAFTEEAPDGPYLVDETIQIIDPTSTPAT